jgi:hypothetical protein
MQAVTGVFGTMAAAERIREQLIENGVSEGRITLSRPITEDPIAGEWMGQSYENQPNQGSGRPREHDTSGEAHYNEAVRSGVCVVSVDVAGDDADTIQQVLRAGGARETAHREGDGR